MKHVYSIYTSDPFSDTEGELRFERTDGGGLVLKAREHDTLGNVVREITLTVNSLSLAEGLDRFLSGKSK